MRLEEIMDPKAERLEFDKSTAEAANLMLRATVNVSW